jgi:putative tryptophan/tyrosine transport system substrate-binding protein
MKRREFIPGLGSAAVGSLAARAQQAALPVIGYLSGNAESAIRSLTAAFREGLAEQGYVEGQKVEIVQVD